MCQGGWHIFVWCNLLHRDLLHRETEESTVVVRREDVSTIETEVVRVRSIRISSSRPVVAIVAREPQ